MNTYVYVYIYIYNVVDNRCISKLYHEQIENHRKSGRVPMKLLLARVHGHKQCHRFSEPAPLNQQAQPPNLGASP